MQAISAGIALWRTKPTLPQESEAGEHGHKHYAYKRVIRWIIDRKDWYLQNQYLNNWMEQHHRPVGARRIR
jgi:hypothetical protein